MLLFMFTPYAQLRHLKRLHGHFAACRTFTALHGMQTRPSDENSVCPSVCLSVCPSVRPSAKRVDCDKTKEQSVQILYHMRDHLA